LADRRKGGSFMDDETALPRLIQKWQKDWELPFFCLFGISRSETKYWTTRP
jgi:hypothetical protein